MKVINLKLSGHLFQDFLSEIRNAINRDFVVFLIAKYLDMKIDNFESFGNSEFKIFLDSFNLREGSNYVNIHENSLWDGETGLYRHSLQKYNYTCTQDPNYNKKCMNESSCIDSIDCKYKHKKIWKKDNQKKVSFASDYIQNLKKELLSSNLVPIDKLITILYGQKKYDFINNNPESPITWDITQEKIDDFKKDFHFNDQEFNELFFNSLEGEISEDVDTEVEGQSRDIIIKNLEGKQILNFLKENMKIQ